MMMMRRITRRGKEGTGDGRQKTDGDRGERTNSASHFGTRLCPEKEELSHGFSLAE
jgi:hypothetical protein